jgi:hypothetical protein
MIVLPRSFRLAAYPIEARNDIITAIAPAYGFGSQRVFPQTAPVLQIPAGNAGNSRKGWP